MNEEALSMTPIVEARDLWKTYPLDKTSVEALRGVNLTIEVSEFVAMVGPSGSGKSTLLHLIGAMDTPTRGDVFLNGLNLAHMSDSERTRLRCCRIGFVFQTFNLLPTLSALENVEIAMRLAGIPSRERRQRAAELLERVGLGERMRHAPCQLSGGERQRVALARALANQPALLLADEPTGNLDSTTGESIVALLQQLNNQGQTIVLVTHNAEMANQAGRVLRMRDGQIQ
jgi:putative ABC transport system ATP-binding protein